jgi:hypothetical protein
LDMRLMDASEILAASLSGEPIELTYIVRACTN